MNANDQNRMKELLKGALPPVAADAEPARDLWSAVLRRLDQDLPAASDRRALRSMQWSMPWFDWALLGGLAVFTISFPATIPVLLYYL